MSYVIKAVLSNPRRPEYGQTTIPFPIPDSEYDHTIELLEAMGSGAPTVQDCQVDELDSSYPILNRLLAQSVRVDELDYLAKRLDSCLPEEIEKTAPDYSIYPAVDYAIGFLTRGCCRCCPWCIVPVKEGQIRPASTWEEIKRPDSGRIIFMDNNVLASPHGLQQIEAMGGQKIWVDFNQGLDARLVTPKTAALLARLRWIRFVRLSCDTTEMLPVIEQAVAYMREAGIAKSRFWAYMLVQDVEDAKNRAIALDRMGVEPFAQPYRDYDGSEPTRAQKQLAHWVNKKSVFHSCTWEEIKKQ